MCPFTELDPKKKSFALSLIANEGNISKASSEVGISRMTGTKWKNDPTVQEFIKSLSDSTSEEILTAQDVLVHLSKIASGDTKHQILNIKGEVVELEDVHAKVNALKQLSKIYGMERTVIEETQRVFVIGGDMGDDESRERKVIDSVEMDYLLEEGDEEDGE
jgi:hypothetical protein